MSTREAWENIIQADQERRKNQLRNAIKRAFLTGHDFPHHVTWTGLERRHYIKKVRDKYSCHVQNSFGVSKRRISRSHTHIVMPYHTPCRCHAVAVAPRPYHTHRPLQICRTARHGSNGTWAMQTKMNRIFGLSVVCTRQSIRTKKL